MAEDQVRALEHVYLQAGPDNAGHIAAANVSIAGAVATGACDAEYGAFKAGVDALASIGIPTIVAAGNAGAVDGLGAPACVSTAVAVGASDRADRLAAFSNRSYISASLSASPGAQSPSCS